MSISAGVQSRHPTLDGVATLRSLIVESHRSQVKICAYLSFMKLLVNTVAELYSGSNVGVSMVLFCFCGLV